MFLSGLEQTGSWAFRRRSKQEIRRAGDGANRKVGVPEGEQAGDSAFRRQGKQEITLIRIVYPVRAFRAAKSATLFSCGLISLQSGIWSPTRYSGPDISW